MESTPKNKKLCSIPEQLDGLNVIPVEPNSKKPVEGWKEYQKKKYDKELLSATNYAVVCGEISNNLVVHRF